MLPDTLELLSKLSEADEDKSHQDEATEHLHQAFMADHQPPELSQPGK